MKKYIDLFVNHKDLVSDKWEQYLFAYQELLEKYQKQEKPVNLLEIGVQNGGSLQIWEKFLPAGSQIYGIDINPKCKDLKFSDNIHFYLGDASKESFWHENLLDVTFDIILDDGSHLCQEVIETFEFLFLTKLNMGGIYLIEDIHTSYWPKYQGGYKASTSSIEYFKNFIDYLNINYIKLPPSFDAKGIEPLKEMNSYIKKISFYDSICAIEKYNKRLNKPFERFLAGTFSNVVVDPDFEKLKVENNIDKLKSIKKHFEW